MQRTRSTGKINLHGCVPFIDLPSNLCVHYEHLLDNGTHPPLTENGIHHDSQLHYKCHRTISVHTEQNHGLETRFLMHQTKTKIEPVFLPPQPPL